MQLFFCRRPALTQLAVFEPVFWFVPKYLLLVVLQLLTSAPINWDSPRFTTNS